MRLYKLKRAWLLLIVMLGMAASGVTAQKVVTGVVTDEKGEPIIGANVVVKGTSTGSITDIDGNFSFNTGEGKILVISYIGYQTQEVPLVFGSQITVKLTEDSQNLDEVVVTALGIKKNKRSLAYSTEQVNMESLQTAKTVNLGDGLAGKIAGVSITSGTGSTGVGTAPRIDIRGSRTINGNNQPLIVVDGVVWSADGSGLNTLNPDDIESMNVLKGPSAAALYGSQANNGVIVVTTKKGADGMGKLEVNSLTTFDIPSWYPEMQNLYGQGLGGTYNPTVDRYSWGPKMDGHTVKNFKGEDVPFTPQPNNVKDLFRTGINATNTVSYSGGNKKATYYFSYANTTASGLLRSNDLQRNILNSRITAEILKNVTADVKLNYSNNSLKNTPEGGDGTWSPMHMALVMPRSIRTADIRDWSYIDDFYNTRQTTWCPGSAGTYNPYFSMNARQNPSTYSSFNAIASLRWEITKFLYVQLRGNLNNSTSDAELKIMWDAPYTNGGKGDYQTTFDKSRQMNGDLLVGFDKELGSGFRLNANVGAEIKDLYARSMSSVANGLALENLYFLNNGIRPVTSDRELRIQRQSIYGTAQVGWRNMVFLDVTARSDWSSTLPAPHQYFYPSFGLTGIISDMVKLPKVISFLKVRGSWAEVGNDVGFAQIYQTYSRESKFPLGKVSMSSTKVATNMIPERTRSIEIGGEIKFFENRLGIDVSWYKTNSFNQLITISTPAASGFNYAQVNCGNIQNHGIELMISGTPVKTKEFTYDAYLIFTKNNNVVKELYDGVDRVSIGTPELALGSAFAMVGRPYGELFDYGMVRNDQGKLIINETTGLPTMSNDPISYYLGNQNYDFRSSLNNSFTYKNWNLNFLIDLNVGGVRQSATESVMMVSGTSAASLSGRENGLVLDGVIKNADGSFRQNDIKIDAYAYANFIGGRSGVGELYNYDATNARLRELSIGYRFDFGNQFFKNVHLSLVGRNLFYFYNKCGWFDPDQTSDTNKNGQGSEVSFLPHARQFGFNVKATF